MERIYAERGVDMNLKKSKFIFQVLFVILFAFGIGGKIEANKVLAAGKITVTGINYEENKISLKANNGDKKIYFSDAKMSKWSVVPGEMNANKEIDFDISWVSLSRDNTLTFRSDVSTEPVVVKLPKRLSTFKAAYDITNAKITFTNVPDGRSIEWKKVGSSVWKQTTETTIQKELKAFYHNGASLIFRVKSTPGTSAEQTGNCASKEVSVKIPKRTSAPTILLDGSKFTVNLKSGMAYKKTVEPETEWKKVTSETNVKLSEIDNSVLSTGGNNGTDITLDFRVNASSKQQESQVTTVKVLGQEKAPTTGITGRYTSKKGYSIRITANEMYECTKVANGVDIDYSRAVWTTVCSSADVNFQEVAAGDKIYVRKKAKGKTDTGYGLASASYMDTLGTSSVTFDPEITAGVNSTMPYGSKTGLSLTVKNTTNDKVRQILIAGREIELSTNTLNGNTITAVLSPDSMWERLSAYMFKGGDLPVKVILKNGEMLTTTLKLLPSSGLNAGSTASFKRVLGASGNSIDIVLKFASTLSDGSYPIVDRVVCNNVPLVKTVSYDAVKGTAAITAKLDNVGVVNENEKYGITVELSNGEVLKNLAFVTFEPVASFGTGTVTESFPKGAYQNSLDIKMVVHEDAVGATIRSIKGGSTDFAGKYTYKQVGREIILTLQKEALNSLPAGTSELTITFSNGAEVSKGYRFVVSAATISASFDSQTDLSQMISLAATAGEIPVKAIDYDEAEIIFDSTSISEIYYSTDKKEWKLIEDPNQVANQCSFDISWVSSKKETTLYFKGSSDAITEVVLPEYNSRFSVKFDKATSEFTFNNVEGLMKFQWKKALDSNWKTVENNKTSSSYEDFAKEIDALRTKGCKLLFRTQPVSGSSNTLGEVLPGERPSREASVSMSKRSTAPSIRLNTQKGTLNTSVKLEYCDPNFPNVWTTCTKNMTVSDAAATALASGTTTGKDLMLLFRKAETSRTPYSLESAVFFPGQRLAPVVGTDVICTYSEKGVLLRFPNASKEKPFEYGIVKSGGAITAKTRWKSVTRSERDMVVSKKNAPNNSIIYVRAKGVKENVRKGIEPELYSANTKISVTHP